ncbi:hypothetical protein [Haliangium sp. UPWRP_2]|nr:hypothetical protein [Haliangium sp. UPWRP_2]
MEPQLGSALFIGTVRPAGSIELQRALICSGPAQWLVTEMYEAAE